MQGHKRHTGDDGITDGSDSESPIIVFYLASEWGIAYAKNIVSIFLKCHLMIKWKIAKEWSNEGYNSTTVLQTWRGLLNIRVFTEQDLQYLFLFCIPITKHNKPKLSVVLQAYQHGREAWFTHGSGPTPVLWANISNRQIFHINQPAAWTSYSSLAAILDMDNANTEHWSRACGVWGFPTSPNNLHFSSASIAAPISACWMLDWTRRGEKKRGRKGL